MYYFEDNYVKVKGYGYLVLGKKRFWLSIYILIYCIGFFVLV